MGSGATRSFFPRLLEIELPPGQSAFLWGARKSGKTTLLRQRFADSAHFDLLDSDLYLALLKRPALLREWIAALSAAQRAEPIVIDEVQKVPLLLDEVHKQIEDQGLRFILCGSGARKLKRQHANLLGGRAWRYLLHPLTSREIPDLDLLRALQWGLLPSHYLSPQPARSLAAYVTDYLREEIRDEGLARNLAAFGRFLDAAAFSAGELVNYSNVARDTGVDAKTVKEYFQILVDTHLAYLIAPIATRGSRQVISATPRFYLFDTGVANQIAGRRFTGLAGSEAGRAFEQFILMELMAYRSYRDPTVEIRYWRTKSGLEVDFVLTGPRPVGIEVTVARRVDRADIRGLIALCEEHRLVQSLVVCLEPRARVVAAPGGEIRILPWRQFLDLLWAGEVGGGS